jgi:uncharacterized SAM-binding protein YcdF (DUF218 family)
MFDSDIGFWSRQVVSGLVQLPTSPILVAMFGLLVMRRRRAAGVFLVGLATTALLLLSMPVVANVLARADEARYPPLDPASILPPRAAIVVLGGGLQTGATDYGGETVSPTTLARLRSAARLALRSHLPVLVSGGRLPSTSHTEARMMTDVMTNEFHAPVTWLEGASLDTGSNARLSARMLKDADIDVAVLVTDASSMRRAAAEFERAGMKVVPAPTDYYANAPVTVFSFIPNPNALRRSNWILHERLGLLWMRIRGGPEA